MLPGFGINEDDYFLILSNNTIFCVTDKVSLPENVYAILGSSVTTNTNTWIDIDKITEENFN